MFETKEQMRVGRTHSLRSQPPSPLLVSNVFSSFSCFSFSLRIMPNLALQIKREIKQQIVHQTPTHTNPLKKVSKEGKSLGWSLSLVNKPRSATFRTVMQKKDKEKKNHISIHISAPVVVGKMGKTQ